MLVSQPSRPHSSFALFPPDEDSAEVKQRGDDSRDENGDAANQAEGFAVVQRKLLNQKAVARRRV